MSKKPTRSPAPLTAPPAPANGRSDLEGEDIGEETLSPSQLRRLQSSRMPPDAVLGAEMVTFEEEDRIREILGDELNEAALLEIFRKDKQGRWAYLCNHPLFDWNSDAKALLAKKYGGGDYKGQVRRMAEGSRGQRGQSFQFTIDHSLRPEGAAEESKASDPFAVFERMNSQNPIMPLFMQMMKTQQDNMAMMMQLQQQHTATLVATLKGSGSPPPSERLMEVLLTKALAPSQGTDLAGLLGVVAKLKQLTDSSADNPRSNSGDGLFDKVLSALPSVLKTLSSLQMQAPPPVALPPAPPAPAAAPVVPSGEVTAPPPAAGPVQPVASAEADATRLALASFLPQVIALADAGHTPEAVAQTISETIDDPTFVGLVILLERPDWLAVLSDVHEPVLMRSPFFAELRERLLDLAPEADESPGPHE